MQVIKHQDQVPEQLYLARDLEERAREYISMTRDLVASDTEYQVVEKLGYPGNPVDTDAVLTFLITNGISNSIFCSLYKSALRERLATCPELRWLFPEFETK